MSKLILEDIRCSYVFVTEQRKKDTDVGEPTGGYGMQLLIPKESKYAKKINEIVDKVLVDKFGKDALSKKGKYKLPLRDGDEEQDGAEYEGMYFLNANSKNKKPGLVNKKNRPPSKDDIEDYCYSGATFTVSVKFYAFLAKDGGKPGVAVGLSNVMLRSKGDRLDGSVSAEDEFAGLASEDDEDDEDF